MQINIDKKTGIFTGIIIVLLAIIVSMSLSRDNDNGFFGMHGNGMMDSNRSQGSGKLSGSDIMFLQMMIPHHEGAVQMAEGFIQFGKDPQLISMAKKMIEDQLSIPECNRPVLRVNI